MTPVANARFERLARAYQRGLGTFLETPAKCSFCEHKRAYRQMDDGYLCEPCAEVLVRHISDES